MIHLKRALLKAKNNENPCVKVPTTWLVTFLLSAVFENDNDYTNHWC